MKKLFSDNVVSKLRPLPSFLWIVFVALSFYFARAYEFLLIGEYYANFMAEAYQELGMSINTVTIGICFSLLEGIIMAFIVELILAISYNMVAGRYRCQINRSDFKFRVRYFVVIVNLVLGVLSIGYFFTQMENGVINPNISLFSGKINLDMENPYQTIQGAFLPFVAFGVLAIFFFEDFRERYVPPRNQAPLFSRFGLLYVGINLILLVYDLFRSFLLIDNPTPATTVEIIAYSLQGASYVAIAVVYYLYYLKLKKEQGEVKIEVIMTEDKGKKENIYDDFGF